MTAHLAPATFDARALEALRLRLDRLGDDDLDRPVTPEWSLRDLLAHVVGGNLRFAAVLRGEAADWTTRDDEVVTSLRTELDATAEMLATAVAGTDPSARVAMSGVPMSASFAVAMHATDLLLHAWDVAVATGQDTGLGPDLCEAGLAVLGRYPDELWGPGRVFAARLEPVGEDPASQLLALSGRVAGARPAGARS